MISEKENIMRFYRHEKPYRLPDVSYIHYVHPAKGFLERPVDSEDMTTDWFGVEYVYDANAKVSLPDIQKKPVVSDILRWREEVVFPDLDGWDWEKAAGLDGIENVDREQKLVVPLVQCGLYERLHSLMGMEAAMVAMLTDPYDISELLDAIAQYKIKLFEYIIEYYKPDIIRHHDDWGTQVSMQMSPAIWRELIKPHVAKFVEVCHNKGVLYEQHSCGLIEPIIPDLVQIGVDSWQGMHINDVVCLKNQTCGRLNYHMSLDVQKYMADDHAGLLDETKLRKSVRDTILSSAEGGHYFPVLAINDQSWWGTGVIIDEISNCIEVMKY